MAQLSQVLVGCNTVSDGADALNDLVAFAAFDQIALV